MRLRGDMVEDQTQARNRLTHFLLRHSIVWRGGSNWTYKHQRWLASLRFDDRPWRRRSRTTGRRSACVTAASTPSRPT